MRAQFLMRSCVAAAVFVCVTQVACSLELNWDVSRLACDANALCLEGYSCLGTHCIANNAQSVGEPCNQQIQCGGGEVCTASYLDRPCNGDSSCMICAAGCDITAAYTTGACGTSAYCSVFCNEALSSYSPPPPYYTWCDFNARQGVCVVSDGCQVNEACTLVNQTAAGNGNATGVCVDMSDGVTACMQACSFNFSSASNHDGCGSTTANNLTCQPIGAAGAQQMVCIPPIKGQELVPGNTGCNAGNKICSPGNACIDGVCRVLCSTATPNCGTQTCTELTGLAPPPAGINTSGVGYCH